MKKNILTKLQSDFLREFGKEEISKNFYLTGGTLLAAYYLGHRYSEDLDLFTDKDPDEIIDKIHEFIEKFAKKYSIGSVDKKRIFDRREFNFRNGKEKLKVEFVKYDFPSMGERIIWPEFNIKIDSPEDLMANKVISAIDRNEPKDMIDIYYLIKKGHKIEEMIKLFYKKFEMQIDKLTAIREIIRLENRLDEVGPLLLVPKSKQKQEIEKIKEFFIEMSNEYLRSVFV